jgi:hypothetical protein
MLTFSELDKRLRGLTVNLDGQRWLELLDELDPPKKKPTNLPAIHDMFFRDTKALAGYMPDLRTIMSKISPKSLSDKEKEALLSVSGLLNFSARLLVLLLLLPDYQETEVLIELYNGYRQILCDINGYLKLCGPEN